MFSIFSFSKNKLYPNGPLTTKLTIKDIETKLIIWEVKCEFQYLKGLNVIKVIV